MRKKLHAFMVLVTVTACSFLFAGGDKEKERKKEIYKRKNPLPSLSISIPEKKDLASLQKPIIVNAIREPQKQPGELYAIIKPSWVAWIRAGGRHVRDETMKLVQNYDPARQEFGSGVDAENESLLLEACESFDRNHEPVKKMHLLTLCHTKSIKIPGALAIEAAMAVKQMGQTSLTAAPESPEFGSLEKEKDE